VSAASTPSVSNQRSQTLLSLLVSTAWLPVRPAEKVLESLGKLIVETRQKLSGSDSEAAKDLRASLGGYDTAVNETAQSVRQYRRDMLAQLGLNPDNYIA